MLQLSVAILNGPGKRCSSIMIPIPERTCSWSCVAPNPEVIAKRSISLQLNLISCDFHYIKRATIDGSKCATILIRRKR